MGKRYPTVAQQEQALDEMKRILGRDIDVMTSSDEPATAAILERVVLFEGVLNMFDILEEKIVAGVMLAGKIKGYDQPVDQEMSKIIQQAEVCLELMIGKEEGK